MNEDEFKYYLNNIYKETRKRVCYKDDSIKNIILDCVKTGGRREANYIQIFKLIIARVIKYAEGFPDHNMEKRGNYIEKNLPVDAINDLNMAVFFEVIDKKFKKKLCKIYKIEIINRKTLDKIFSREV